jgi:hypothetical protein
MSEPYNKIGSSYQDKERLSVKWFTTYQAVGGTAVAQGLNVNTSLVSTSFPNFAVLISNLWSEYRCTSLTIDFKYTFNTAQSGLYIPSVYTAQFRGNLPPAQTLAGLTAVPWVVTHSPPSKHRMTWKASTDDPENWIFQQTSGALPVTGGIVGYIGAAAPTTTVAYLVAKVTAVVEVRGRKV